MNKDFVIVTGGSHGIGAGICKLLLQEGYFPIILDREEPNHQAFHQFEKVDLSDSKETERILKNICKHNEVLRLVNNVGIVRPALLENTSIDDFFEILNLNARTALSCMKALLPGMRKAKFGRIVNISSRVVLGKIKRTAYAASKGALGAMTRTWALETAPDGITVNSIAPGPIATDAFNQNNPPSSQETQKIIRNIPVKRMGKPEDVAHAVSFFLNKKNSFITGQTLYVCGGLTVGTSM